MDSKLAKNFYVTLNSLVDIRLGLALYARPKLIDAKDRVIFNYLERKRDNVGYVPYTIIEDLYRYRLDDSILKLSSPTPLLHNVIIYQIQQLQDENDIRREVNKLTNKLFINTYPFSLNDDSIAYIKILAKNVMPDVEIEVVRMSIKEVTPDWIIKNDIKAMYDYYGEDWLCYHTHNGNIFDTQLNDVVMHVPKINNSSLPIQELTDGFFKLVEASTSTIIPLVYLPAYFFSAYVKDFYTEGLINEVRAINDSGIKINIAKKEEIVDGDKCVGPNDGSKW